MKSYEMILEMARQFVKPGPRAKFQEGDKVKVTGEDDPAKFRTYHGKKRLGLMGKEGIVVGYDYYPGAYSKFLVKFEDGTKDAIHSHFLVPAQTEGLREGIDKTIQLIDKADPATQAAAQDRLNLLKPYGVVAAGENDLPLFKGNIIKSSYFLNNISKGQKSERSKFNFKHLRIYLIGKMKLYSSAPSFSTFNDTHDCCAPVFDKNNPVFYLWYASSQDRIGMGGKIDEKEGIHLSFPQVMDYDEHATTYDTPLIPVDIKYTFVQVIHGHGIDNMVAETKRLASGKKPRYGSAYVREAQSLLRIGRLLSIKDMKGVEQGDMDALMSL